MSLPKQAGGKNVMAGTGAGMWKLITGLLMVMVVDVLGTLRCGSPPPKVDHSLHELIPWVSSPTGHIQCIH